MAYLKGIDVSRWQGNVDFKKVKPNVDFVIIKCGGNEGGYYKDIKFETFYKDATAQGIPLGCYFYTGKNFNTEAQGKADALKFCEQIKGKTFKAKVWVDIEEVPTGNQANVTKCALAFINQMKLKGYECGIYASDISGFQSRMDLSKLKNVEKWVARYGSSPKYATSWTIWQYSSTGKVNGINGNVDMNYAQANFLTKTTTTKTTTKATTTTKVTNSFLPSKGYWCVGDKDERIGKLCQFYYDTFPAYADVLKRDKKDLLGNTFGANCKAWTQEFQRRTGVSKPSGRVDLETYNKLKQYKFKYQGTTKEKWE